MTVLVAHEPLQKDRNKKIGLSQFSTPAISDGARLGCNDRLPTCKMIYVDEAHVENLGGRPGFDCELRTKPLSGRPVRMSSSSGHA
jgi:hypothetical protein